MKRSRKRCRVGSGIIANRHLGGSWYTHLHGTERLEDRLLLAAVPVPQDQASIQESIADVGTLDQATLESIVEAAAERWRAAGLSEEQSAALDAIDYGILDLGGNALGAAQGYAVLVDDDAAGKGWFIDATPWQDEEFSAIEPTVFMADAGSASGAIDLLTTVMHEQGHVLGLLDADGSPSDLMFGTLSEGERRLPTTDQADGAEPGSVTELAYIRLNEPLPAGGRVLNFLTSPDSSRVVYRAEGDTDNVYELYSRAIDGSGAQVKLNDTLPTGGDVFDFLISPDSSSVVYRAEGDTDEVFELYSRAIDGSGSEVKLNAAFPAGGDVLDFLISPDSSTVVFRADGDTDGVDELYSRPIDGSGSEVKLSDTLPTDSAVLDFRISPDSSSVVFRAGRDGGEGGIYQLYSRAIDGSGSMVSLTPPEDEFERYVVLPDFLISSDSSRVVYSVDVWNYFNRLYSTAIDGSGTEVELRFGISGFLISPDSSRVVYQVGSQYDSPQRIYKLYSRAIDGSGSEVKLNAPLPTGGGVESFLISPDSSRVVFSVDDETNSVRDIYSRAIDGSDSEVKLNAPLPAGGDVSSFLISPDSSRVVYRADGDTDGVDELYSRAIGGSGFEVKLNDALPAGGNVNSFLISPDSSSVVYRADGDTDGIEELYASSIDGTGSELKLNAALPTGGNVDSFLISPDSSRVVYRADGDTDGVDEIYSEPLLTSIFGVTVGGTINVTEGTLTDSYVVVLDTMPTADVEITVTPDSQTDLGAGPGTAIVLNFTPSNALTPQTVNVTAVDDAVFEGPHTSTITHTATSADGNYDGIAINSVIADITDNDLPPGVAISGAIDVTEGFTDSYDVILDSVPTADVEITVTPDSQTDLGAGAGTAIVLTFTPGNAQTPQTVNVTAVDDAVFEGPHTSTITHTATSADSEYDGIAINSVTANITDNDGTPVYVSFSSGGTLPGRLVFENEDIIAFDSTDFSLLFDGSDVGLGGAMLDAFAVIAADEILLSFRFPQTIPGIAAEVQGWDIVKFTANRLGEETSGTFELFFRGSDVGLGSLENIDAIELHDDGRLIVSIDNVFDVGGLTGNDEDLFAFTPLAPGNYSSGTWEMYFDGSDVEVAREDLDGIALDSSGDIHFSTTNDFAVTGVSGDDEDVLTFMPSQLGEDTSGAYASTLLFDGSLFGLDAQDVSGIDLPIPAATPGVTISGTIDVAEGTITDSYAVVLGSVPTADVEITVTPDSQVDLGAGPGTAIVLSFTPGTALTPQMVNVTAVDDAVVEGPHSSTITHTATSTDSNYDGIAINSVIANIIDNDMGPGVTINGTIDVAEGFTESYDVVLSTVPSADVQITITPDSQTDLGAGAETAIVLSFTPSNAGTPQTVNVTAVDDAVVEGPHTSTITHTATSADSNYDGISIQSVIANIAGNPLYLSFHYGRTLPDGLVFENEDILAFDGTDFSLLFDGSDVGLAAANVDAFAVITDDEILISFSEPQTIPGIIGTVEDSDIVKFTATGLGEETTGTFGLFFRGSDVGLAPTDEDIDAVELHDDGRLIVSTIGNFDVPGLAGADKDLNAFTPGTPGDYSSGTWAMYFDGSDVGLLDAAAEDVDAVALDSNGQIHLSTKRDFAVTGVSGDENDVFTFMPSQLGTDTTGTYASTLLFDGSLFGLFANVNGIDLPIPAAPPGVTVSSTIDVSEGLTDSYVVVLDTVPTADVQITVTPDSQTDLGAGPRTAIVLSFTPSNALTPQTVNVLAVDDAMVEGPHTSTITHTATSADGNYDGIAMDSLYANITDNDTAYLSFNRGGTLPGGLVFENEDILVFDGTDFSLLFDGSDVGLHGASLDAFAVIAADEILLSFRSPETIAGITVEDSDIVKFTATELGEETSGTFELFLRGSDVGLSPTAEDIDAIELHDDGRLIVSTIGSFDVPDVTGGDADLIAFTPGTRGDYSSGTWAMYFDASDVGLGADDVDAVALDSGGRIHLSTKNAFAVAGVSGDNEDVFTFVPSQLGADTSGTYASTLLFDGSQLGLNASDVSGIDLPFQAAGVTVGGPIDVTEGTLTDNYVVALDRVPTADVEITVTPDSQTDLGAGPGTAVVLTFTPSNAGTPQTVNVTAVDDAAVEGPHTSSITHTASSADGNYDGIAIDSVTANITDNDTAYLSLNRGGTLPGGLVFENEDILAFDGTDFSLVFDGSDVGLHGASLDAFSVIAADEILLSFRSPETIAGITVEDSDIVKFTATGLGEETSGTFEMFFGGSDVGLSPTAEDIDAIELHDDGRLIVSTIGSFDVPGVTGGDADLIAFTPGTPGDYSSGTWAMYFDASDVGLGADDVDAVALDSGGRIHLSTKNAFALTGVSGDNEDVFTFVPSQLGAETLGTYASTLLFDGSQFGLDASNVSGIDLPITADSETVDEAVQSGFQLAFATNTTATADNDGSSTTAGTAGEAERITVLASQVAKSTDLSVGLQVTEETNIDFPDLNGDGFITPLDALLVINWLNGDDKSKTRRRLDVNGDDFITPIDALLVINHLHKRGPREQYFAAMMEGADDDDELVDEDLPALLI